MESKILDKSVLLCLKSDILIYEAIAKSLLVSYILGVCKALTSHIKKNQIQSLGNNWK